jgi:hypothetical protein
MFKQASWEDEIYHSMEKQLVSNQLENSYGFKRLVQAAEYLSKAASIFEAVNMADAAEGITQTLQSLANDLQEAKSKEDNKKQMLKHVEQVKNRLASLSGDDKWLGVKSEWLLPEMQYIGNPEKEAQQMHAFKQLKPSHFPDVK